MTKALMILSDYGWVGVLLWTILGLALGGLTLLGFFCLAFAGVALPRALYWLSWILLLLFPTFFFVTLRLAIDWQKLRSERRA
jgi:hypothetical protein